jgi:hypothetical protein
MHSYEESDSIQAAMPLTTRQCVTLACFPSGGAANHPWSFSWPENAKRMKLETQRPPEGCGGGGIRGGVNGTHFSIAGSLVIVPGSVLGEQASEIS